MPPTSPKTGCIVESADTSSGEGSSFFFAISASASLSILSYGGFDAALRRIDTERGVSVGLLDSLELNVCNLEASNDAFGEETKEDRIGWAGLLTERRKARDAPERSMVGVGVAQKESIDRDNYSKTQLPQKENSKTSQKVSTIWCWFLYRHLRNTGESSQKLGPPNRRHCDIITPWQSWKAA